MATAGLLAACQPIEGCTDVGWYEGLTIEVRPAGDAMFPEGTYRYDIVADGTELSLALDYRGGVATCVGQDTQQCVIDVELGGGRRLEGFVEMIPFGDGTISTASVSLSYWENEAAGGPVEARLRVLRDGVEIGAATFAPAYQTDEPNGAGCGWSTTASDTLVVRP